MLKKLLLKLEEMVWVNVQGITKKRRISLVILRNLGII